MNKDNILETGTISKTLKVRVFEPIEMPKHLAISISFKEPTGTNNTAQYPKCCFDTASVSDCNINKNYGGYSINFILSGEIK